MMIHGGHRTRGLGLMDFLCFISQHLGTRAEKAIFWLLLETEISLSLVLNSCTGGNLGSPAFWDTGLQRVVSRGRGKMCSVQWSQLLCVPMWQPRLTRAKRTPQSFQQQCLWDPALLLEDHYLVTPEASPYSFHIKITSCVRWNSTSCHYWHHWVTPFPLGQL